MLCAAVSRERPEEKEREIKDRSFRMFHKEGMNDEETRTDSSCCGRIGGYER